MLAMPAATLILSPQPSRRPHMPPWARFKLDDAWQSAAAEGSSRAGLMGAGPEQGNSALRLGRAHPDVR
jgi:hypothetical protein